MSKIEVKNLTKTFTLKDMSVEALKNINLSIEAGDIYGIIGMSGAGKSTLVRCLNYLEKPTDGQVIVGGQDLGLLTDKQLREKRSKISMIFQGFNLLMQKSVIDNVCFPLRLQGIKKSDARKRALELLNTVGLEEKGKAYPAQLSGGQQQRVAIARALASDPEILLCDEATSALDPQTTAQILDLLKKINVEMGITIVVITHQMAVIREICNKVAIIENGVLVENGEVKEIFAQPKSRAAKELILRDLPDADKKVQRDVVDELKSEKIIRIVFSENSSYEPVISNVIMKFNAPINILRADTKNVGGTAVGEMILGLPSDEHLQVDIIKYLKERGLQVKEVEEDV